MASCCAPATTENPDLFWALRGGGGNFGVVTAFEFQLHHFGPQVLSGLVVHPFADADKVLREYRKALETAPDELTCWVVMRQAPPLPFLPAEWHGKEVLVLAMCYCGDIQRGRKGDAEASRHRHADRRCRRPQSVHRLAAGLRPAAYARRPQLLEEP